MRKWIVGAVALLVAAISAAEITYPVDVANTQWAVMDNDNGEIIKRRAAWPVADGGPIPGLDPRYVYLLHIDAAQPDYDSRLYYLEGTETVDAPANELRLEWVAIKRPTAEQIISAENADLDTGPG